LEEYEVKALAYEMCQKVKHMEGMFSQPADAELKYHLMALSEFFAVVELSTFTMADNVCDNLRK